MPEIERKSSRSNKTISDLAKQVRILASDKEIKSKVDERIREFERLRSRGGDGDWFSELCFCIMTANSTAQLGMRIQRSLGRGCLTLSPKEVQELLRKHGHRFARPRAEYICSARAHRRIKSVIESFPDDRTAREWLVKNILGLGYKEASHFLRNTGHFDVAILDRHILRVMEEYSLIPHVPKTLTRKRYLEIEGELAKLADRLNMPLGVLDLYLWYMRTGQILK
ncbi:MAG: N-glycosylase/DNA lyase [Thermoplasmata archaeon]